jgi:NitT/TauT family transport system substrate-binding protein
MTTYKQVQRSIGKQKTWFFCLILAILLLCGCERRPEEAQLERISIAFQEWVGYGPLYLAQEKGFFKEEGIDLVFVDEQLDSARRDAFKQGMLDCEAGTIDLLVSKRAEDTPIVAVLEIDHSLGSDGIVATKDIRTVKDLIGKKVAFARDDVGETFISYLFQKNGLSLNDIIIVPRGPDDAWLAFLSGEADAAVTWEPWLSKATQRPGGHILTSTRDEPDIIIDTLNIRQDIVKNNPELVKGLMRGWFKAVIYCKEHPVESSEIIAKHYDVTPGEYREQITGLKWFGYEEQLQERKAGDWVSAFNVISEIKFANGRIPRKPNVAKAIDSTLLEGLYENSQ